MDAAGLPPQSLLRKASSPKGTPLGNAGNFAATTKSRPLGEGGCERSEQTEGVAFRTASFPAAAQSTVQRLFCALCRGLYKKEANCVKNVKDKNL